MEISDQDVVTLQAVRDLPIVGLNTEVSPEPEQDQSEQDVRPETNQETPELGRCPQSLALIEFRIQQLQNRHFLLLKMQNFTKKTGQSISSETSEDSDELCELDAVQKELEELLLKKEELEKQEGSSNHTANGDHQEHSDLYKCETPHGGVYMLPPLQVHREGQTQPPTGPILPGVELTSSLYTTNMSECIQAFSLSLSFFGDIAKSLGQIGALTQCPSCGEVVVTETRRSVGEAGWTACCLCSMIGCVAGCCLIPLFLKRLKNVLHHCPKCQAHIHTCQPF